jgi:hypothetical protein
MGDDWAPVRAWHRAVNAGDTDAARAVSADGIVMGGPKGETTGVATLVEWVGQSGIHLEPVDWHPVDGTTVVVEQDATWPGTGAAGPQPGTAPVRVATLFRTDGQRVTAALRFDGLHEALAAASGAGRE